MTNKEMTRKDTLPHFSKIWQGKPIPTAYREIDTDLARDNLENDLTFADLQDL